MISNDIAIRVEELSYKYPESDFYSVNNLSLEITTGHCTGIIGPNGAGKSTLISLLCGLLRTNKGKIEYFPNSNKLKSSNSSELEQIIKKCVALIPQDFAFYPELSVKQNLQYFIALNQSNKTKRQTLLDSTLQKCALTEVSNQKACKLSGGYKRRLNIAIALSKEPDIIFLDEPTVGIDPVSRLEIISLLKSLKKQGITLIYTSHMLDEVEQLCDEVILLQQGQTLAFSNNLSNKMFLNIEFTTEEASAKNLQKMGLEFDQGNQQEIEITSIQQLQQLFAILSKDMSAVNNLHFTSNSIDQLYFNNYKASRC